MVSDAVESKDVVEGVDEGGVLGPGEDRLVRVHVNGSFHVGFLFFYFRNVVVSIVLGNWPSV